MPNLNYHCLNHSGMGGSADAYLNLDINQFYFGPEGIESGSLLKGNVGDDTITGGPGADVIYGGPDNDILSGGEDGSQSSNIFVFLSW